MVETDRASEELAVMQVTQAWGCLDAPVEDVPQFPVTIPEQRSGD